MKKIMLKYALLFISMIFLSCTNEELTAELKFENGINELQSSAPGSGGYMIAGLVDEGACSASGRQYTVYATNYPAVNFARTVNVSIYKTVSGQSFEIDGGDVVIPAFSTVSNNMIVFSGANPEKYGNVKVQVLQVTGNNQDISNLYTLVNNSQYANNCFVTAPKGLPGDFCSGEDEDKDGICNCLDSDANGDGFQDLPFEREGYNCPDDLSEDEVS